MKDDVANSIMAAARALVEKLQEARYLASVSPTFLAHSGVGSYDLELKRLRAALSLEDAARPKDESFAVRQETAKRCCDIARGEAEKLSAVPFREYRVGADAVYLAICKEFGLE